MQLPGFVLSTAPSPIEIAARSHANEVADLAGAIAFELGFDPARIERVALAGRLHDIGKICIPRAILEKPGPLEPDEWEIVRRHPEEGARLLSDAGFDDVRPWVLFHHERPDGMGYPFGLKGVEIPVEAAIIAVADAWSAMTSNRPYQSAISEAQAQDVIRAGAGTAWEDLAVAALLAVVATPIRVKFC